MKSQNQLFELTDINKTFYTETVETSALSGINLSIAQGDYLSITGPSGCGKSTLLSLLGILDVANSGRYRLNGQEVASLQGDQAARLRNREIGFVFQSFNLISDLSVADNVELPLTYRQDIAASEHQSLVQQALEKVDMLHRQAHFPAQLSGGQQQRVAIARALVGAPSIILADEPTGNLDSKNAEIIMRLFDELNQTGTTICIVTHDLALAQRANRKIEMFDGKIVNNKPVLGTAS